MKKTDSEIQQAVLRELMWDTRVEETDVGVEVDAGTVTLTGTVTSWAKKIAAQQAAHQVAEVLDVANDIQVRLPGASGRTDSELASAIRHVLEWDAFVPHARVRSTVSDGWVTLEGDVDYYTQRTDAERAVRNMVGVRGISNQIEIKPPEALQQDLRKAIEEAFQRQAQRGSKHIALEVHDGRVTLSGTVHSWAERQAALGAATGTPGVKHVEDKLQIKPYAA